MKSIQKSPPKFSIIVPIYNVESFLKECIDSVLLQDFQDYELICINDGSTDNSLEVLKTFSDSRIKIINQENQGMSCARNAGLDIALGEYIWFIDSDDKIAEHSLSDLNKLIDQKPYDLVFFNATVFFDNKELENKGWFEYKRSSSGEIQSLSFFENEMKNNKLIVQPCCYIFKREFFKNIRFIPHIYHEDNPFFIQLIFQNPNALCYVVKKEFFLRRIRDNSIMTSKKSLKHFLGYSTSIQYLLEYKNENNINNIYYDKFISSLIMGLFHISKQIDSNSCDFELNKYKSFNGLSFKQKIAFRFPWILTFYHFAKKLIKN
ncbi:glycosyltransferase family 2 protein [Acinetobacter towneri]|uniref:glycosyltransferase family 2 protein n=1 Tax=Acinetobacter towneri TaxID=202956 RepID=UPI000369E46B